MYIVLAIFAFGLLVAVHELGHFTAAKLLGVRVNEFAIGMGPKILKKQGKETLYSLRALPFGGFCAMEGENEDTDDPRSFMAQKRWRRVIIFASGAMANFLAAFVIVVILTAGVRFFGGTTLTELVDGFPNEGEHGLMVGDTILSINGEKLYYFEDFVLFMGISQNSGAREVDLVIRRDGETKTLNKFPLQRREYVINGMTQFKYGVTFNRIEATALNKLLYSCYTTMNYVRIIRVSLAHLISGAAGMSDISGPVGIVDAMNNIGQDAETVSIAVASIASFTALIAVNLAVVNMLPIPAMDGGRILFMFITWAIEKVISRRLDPKYEGYINTAAMVLLMGFMALILINDVVKIING